MERQGQMVYISGVDSGSNNMIGKTGKKKEKWLNEWMNATCNIEGIHKSSEVILLEIFLSIQGNHHIFFFLSFNSGKITLITYQIRAFSLSIIGFNLINCCW